jgi:hypothetical protein
MSHRAPVKGRRRGQLCGSHCLSMAGLTAWGTPAHSRQVLSESVGVGVEAKSRGWEQLPRLVTSTAASGAGSTSRPAELSSTVFRPRWAGWGPRYLEVDSEPSPGPRVTPATRLQLPGRVRCVAGLGLSGVAAGVRGVLDSWLPAAVPRRLCAAVQPADGGLSTAESERMCLLGGRPSRSAYTENHWLTLRVGCSV